MGALFVCPSAISRPLTPPSAHLSCKLPCKPHGRSAPIGWEVGGRAFLNGNVLLALP